MVRGYLYINAVNYYPSGGSEVTVAYWLNMQRWRRMNMQLNLRVF